MKNVLAVVCILSIATLTGCATPGVAEDFKWSVECPKAVDRGAEFTLTVRTVGSAGQAVDGVRYRYQILWAGGSSNPLRHKGNSGEAEKVHARMVPGPATIVFTCQNREGLDTKVLETSFEVK